MINKSKKIFLMVFILLFVFSGVSMAVNLKIKIEDNLVLSETEKKVTLRLEDESGKIIKDDRKLMLRINRGGVIENEYLTKGINLKNGKAEFTYLAPKRLGRAEILVIDTKTNKSRKKPLIIVNREQLKRHSESGYATITDFSGEVLVKSGENDIWDSAVVGEKLHKDNFIKTMSDSWSTLSLFDGSEITIEPSTEFKIVNLTGDVNNKQLDQGIFELIVGTVVNKINELTGRGSRFEIETDSATAGVRGTYFEVSYKEGENRVSVYEGSVRTEDKSSEKVYVVNEQEEITVAQEGEDSAGEENIQNQVKKHNTTQEEKIEQIEEKKEEIREKVLEKKANSNKNNKGNKNNNDNGNNGKGIENKGKGNNNSSSNNSNNGKSMKNKGSANNSSSNNNSGGNSDNNSSNDNKGKSKGSENSSSNSNNNSSANNNVSSSNSGSGSNNSGGNSNSNASNDNNGNSNSSSNNSNKRNENNNSNNGKNVNNKGNGNSGANNGKKIKNKSNAAYTVPEEDITSSVKNWHEMLKILN